MHPQKPRIVVLAGGLSGEREVSLRSGAAVLKGLTTTGYEARVEDLTSKVVTKDQLGDCDLVFPVLHGEGGEDGAVQKQLDELGLPYVGTTVTASALCFDKWAYRGFVSKHDVPLPKGELVNSQSFWQSDLIKTPFVLKPLNGGSSLDTLLIRDPDTLNHADVDQLLSKYSDMLLEELVDGIEITVGVVGDTALPVVEIIPPVGGEFDYENKYNGATRELCPPENIPEQAQLKAQELALRIHILTGCRHFSRTDMFVKPDGSLVVLETNTLPGMTDESLLPKAAATAGMPMSVLVDKLVRMAI